jgi:hypothetical protein
MARIFRTTKDFSGNLVISAYDKDRYQETLHGSYVIAPEDLFGVLAALKVMGVFLTEDVGHITKLSLSQKNLDAIGVFTTPSEEIFDRSKELANG